MWKFLDCSCCLCNKQFNNSNSFHLVHGANMAHFAYVSFEMTTWAHASFGRRAGRCKIRSLWFLKLSEKWKLEPANPLSPRPAPGCSLPLPRSSFSLSSSNAEVFCYCSIQGTGFCCTVRAGAGAVCNAVLFPDWFYHRRVPRHRRDRPGSRIRVVKRVGWPRGVSVIQQSQC